MRVFERDGMGRKFCTESGLIISQNSFSIRASQKVHGRLSLDKPVYAPEKGAKCTCGLIEQRSSSRSLSPITAFENSLCTISEFALYPYTQGSRMRYRRLRAMHA